MNTMRPSVAANESWNPTSPTADGRWTCEDDGGEAEQVRAVGIEGQRAAGEQHDRHHRRADDGHVAAHELGVEDEGAGRPAAPLHAGLPDGAPRQRGQQGGDERDLRAGQGEHVVRARDAERLRGVLVEARAVAEHHRAHQRLLRAGRDDGEDPRPRPLAGAGGGVAQPAHAARARAGRRAARSSQWPSAWTPARKACAAGSNAPGLPAARGGRRSAQTDTASPSVIAGRAASPPTSMRARPRAGRHPAGHGDRVDVQQEDEPRVARDRVAARDRRGPRRAPRPRARGRARRAASRSYARCSTMPAAAPMPSARRVHRRRRRRAAARSRPAPAARRRGRRGRPATAARPAPRRRRRGRRTGDEEERACRWGHAVSRASRRSVGGARGAAPRMRSVREPSQDGGSGQARRRATTVSRWKVSGNRSNSSTAARHVALGREPLQVAGQGRGVARHVHDGQRAPLGDGPHDVRARARARRVEDDALVRARPPSRAGRPRRPRARCGRCARPDRSTLRSASPTAPASISMPLHPLRPRRQRKGEQPHAGVQVEDGAARGRQAASPRPRGRPAGSGCPGRRTARARGGARPGRWRRSTAPRAAA